MKSHALLLLFCASVLLVCAFSTGSPAFLLPAVIMLLVTGYALLSVHLVRRSLSVSARSEVEKLRRGETAVLHLMLKTGSWLPVAPIELHLQLGEKETVHMLPSPHPGSSVQAFDCRVHARHVGVFHPGITFCTVRDVFGLVERTVIPRGSCPELIVLPLPFDVTDLEFAPGDAGLGTMARATEDLTSPEDVRAYQSGDPMKKVHWKLSVRKQELMVRRFEEPVLPEAVMLMDFCLVPSGHDNPAALQDAMLESAASVLLHEGALDHAVRMPLYDEQALELSSRMETSLILEHLARCRFSETGDFEHVLRLESRRMRNIGATVIISPVLNGSLAEAMIALRRMGPSLRLYLVTDTPDNPDYLPFILRLQRAMCEVCYVTPAPES